MLSVKILGPGCSKCRTLERKVRELIEKNNIHAEVLKIEEITEMMNSWTRKYINYTPLITIF